MLNKGIYYVVLIQRVLKAENVPSLDTPIVVFTPETMSGKTINIVKTGNVKQGEIIAVIKQEIILN